MRFCEGESMMNVQCAKTAAMKAAVSPQLGRGDHLSYNLRHRNEALLDIARALLPWNWQAERLAAAVDF
jgi:hypothetical protein